MFPNSKSDMTAWMKPGQEAFEYWISFFPTAPLFGVEWRFGEIGDAMKSFAPKSPEPKSKTKQPDLAKVKPASPAAALKATPKPAAPAEKPAAKTTTDSVIKPKEPAKELAKPKTAAKASTKLKATAKAKSPAISKVEKKTAQTKNADKPADGRPAALFAEKPDSVDDLKLIKGIGPGLEKELNGLGVYQFAQVAAFTKADLEWVDENLSAFKGRCFRDDWTGQASALIS
jgi:predicted flap endonuclease-1-like 5' DNA nuclease